MKIMNILFNNENLKDRTLISELSNIDNKYKTQI